MTPNRRSPQINQQTCTQGILSLSNLQTLISQLSPIDLKGMENAALLNRVDTKYLLNDDQLLQILAQAQPHYHILDINNQRMHHYRTLYFDTPDFNLYHNHINCRVERYKVRSREYTDTHLAFLEVKHKTLKGQTIKTRLVTGQSVQQLNAQNIQWLHSFTSLVAEDLQPMLWNVFTRITLVHKIYCERITIDRELTFYNTNQRITLNGLVILEIKTPQQRVYSPIAAALRQQHIQPQGFSKYATGAALLNPNLKQNSIKPQLRQIQPYLPPSHFVTSIA